MYPTSINKTNMIDTTNGYPDRELVLLECKPCSFLRFLHVIPATTAENYHQLEN